MRNSTALVMLLISVGLFYTFILPRYNNVSILRSQSAQYQDILENVVELGQKRDDLEVKYANMPQEDVNRLAKVLPGNADTVSLALNFDSIAAKYGISLRSVRMLTSLNEASAEIIQDTGGKSYQSVIVNLSFTAAYQDFRSFIEDVERSLRIIDIKSVSFAATETGLYDFNVSVQTYWLK